MSAATVWTPHNKPALWEPMKARTMLEVSTLLDNYLNASLPVTRAHMLVIFFHETGYSNIKQGRGTGPAVGFGQMEIFNPDKIPFFKWLTPGFDAVTYNPKIPPFRKKVTLEKNGVTAMMEKISDVRFTSDDDFAVKTHCKYFEWLFTEGYSQSAPTQKGIKSLDGMLAAQTGGGNEHFIGEFRDGGFNLATALDSGERIDIINALNAIRWYFPGKDGPPPGAKTKLTKNGKVLVHNPITTTRYPEYWDFTLPEDDVAGLTSSSGCL